MATTTNIAWSDATWNIARGCHKVYSVHPKTGEKVSECEFCYMMRDSLGGTRYSPETVQQTKTVFNLPLRLKEPQRVFTSSLTDFWHPHCDGFRLEALDIIRKTPHLTYQVLTKRPERILTCLMKALEQAGEQGQMFLYNWLENWIHGHPPKNVWLGVSAGYQHTADKRIPFLKELPAVVRFVSVEPLLESVNLRHHLESGIHWVILGGESGNENGQYRYRPCELTWLYELVSDCKSYGVACFVKQLGTHLQKELGLKTRHATDVTEWPSSLQIQQFPN